jgi:hypothetical protein
MDKNVSALFCLTKAGLWEQGIPLSALGDIDYDEVFRLAEEQSVLGLVTAGMEHVTDVKIPQDVLLQFIGSTLQIEQQNQTMNEFVAQLTDLLRIEGIHSILVKGQGIAQCYEKPLWRASGDVDLLLDRVNYDKAKKLLMPRSETVGNEVVDELHLGMTINGWEVELHGSLHSELSFKLDKQIDEIQNTVFKEGKIRSWRNGDIEVSLPAPDEDVIFVFVHILQHFFKGGIGLRQICDWCRLLWKFRESINVYLLEKRLQSMGLMSEWRSFGSLAVEYLGVPEHAIPFYSSGKKWSKKAEKIISFILEVGNFGHNRDMSYYDSKTYLNRKAISLWRRAKDIRRHATIFPIDSLRFFLGIVFNGIRSTTRGL